jgi:hypothetical protein
MTIREKVAYDLGKSEKEAGLTYVALSRITDVNNLLINNGCSFDRLTSTISKNKKLINRLKEDERLKELTIRTCNFFGC